MEAAGAQDLLIRQIMRLLARAESAVNDAVLLMPWKPVAIC